MPGISELMEKKWGLVLAGGGGKGAYQVGAYKAIVEAGLDKNIVAMSGSSVGTLNMALFGMDDIDMAQSVWKSISPNQFLEIELEKMFDGKEGFISRDGLLNIIDGYVNRDKLKNETRPMYATLSRYIDMVTEEAVSEYAKINQLDFETVKSVLLASSALPFVYEPVKIGNYIYRDGGLTDNLPIKPLYDEGIRDFIVIMLSPNTKIRYDKFPGANFFEIRPSRDLGDIISGTLDFSSKGANIRMDMGYAETKRYIRYYNDADFSSATFKIKMMEMADEEYRQFCNKYKVDAIGSYIDNSVSSVSAYFDKYDIDL